jgi:hypothetical protein
MCILKIITNICNYINIFVYIYIYIYIKKKKIIPEDLLHLTLPSTLSTKFL